MVCSAMCCGLTQLTTIAENSINHLKAMKCEGVPTSTGRSGLNNRLEAVNDFLDANNLLSVLRAH